MSAIDLRFAEGFAIQPVTGAEQALVAESSAFAAGWAALQAALPGATLEPVFAGQNGLDGEMIQDLVDAARMAGKDPPELLRWFAMECPEELLETVLPLVLALPLVAWAGRRPAAVPAAFRDGTVSWGTNPLSIESLHLRRAVVGVDAQHAWRIDGGTGLGVRIADIESGWSLDHEDLIGARISKHSVFGAADLEHGTAILGLIVGADNGVGTVGVAPDASVLLVTATRAGGIDNVAAAILVAARAVGPGGVVLLEVGIAIHPPFKNADVLREAYPPDHAAILAAVVIMGVTVVEPAGNGAIDLDRPPAKLPPQVSHMNLDLSLPSRSDSGAIVVGAGTLIGDPQGWQPSDFSVRGVRVDCFAQGSGVLVPWTPPATYRHVGGTSAAAAIIAGVVAAIQGMATATGWPLAPTDIRNLLRDRMLGNTPVMPGFTGVESMPDLRRIGRAHGWPRVLPVAAAPIGWDSAVLVYLDDDDHLVRRHYSFFAGWGRPFSPAVSVGGDLWAAQPAVISWLLDDPAGVLEHVALASGEGGIHRLRWDSLNQESDFEAVPTASGGTIAPGTAVAAVLAGQDVVVLVGIDGQARLIAMRGDPRVLGSGVSGPVVLSNVAAFRRTAGPAAVCVAPGTVEAIAIADGGSLMWFHASLAATIGTGWSASITEPTATQFVPGARAAALAVDGRVLVAAVGDQGWLHVVEIDPAVGAVEAAFTPPEVVDVTTTIATQGPIALVRLARPTTFDLVVLFAVDTDGLVRVATRSAAGGPWSALLVVPSDVGASPLGGVTAISSPDLGVMVFVVGIDGRIRTTSSRTAVDWDPLLPLTEPDDPWRRRHPSHPVLLSALFAGDEVLEAVAADRDRISRTLNSHGPAVTNIQQALLTWDPASLPVYGADGQYGNETAGEVRRFKRELLGVPASQIVDDVGPATVLALDRIQAAAEGKLGTKTTFRFTDEYGSPLANLDITVTAPDVFELLTTDADGRADMHLASTGRLEIDPASALQVAGNLLTREWPPAGGYPNADAVVTPLALTQMTVEPGADLHLVIATRVNVSATLVAPFAGAVRIEGQGAALHAGPDGQITLAVQANGGTSATVVVDPSLVPGPLPAIPQPVGWTPLGTYTIRPGDTAEGLAEAFVGDPNEYGALSEHPPVAGEVLTLPQVPEWLRLLTDPVEAAAPVTWFSFSPDAIVSAVLAAGDTRPLQDLAAVLDRPPAPAAGPLPLVLSRTEALAAIITQPGPPIGPDRDLEENV